MRYSKIIVILCILLKVPFTSWAQAANKLECGEDIFLEFKANNKMSTTPTRWLTYTPEKLVNYYKSRPYLELLAGIESNNGAYSLKLIAKFESKDIKKSYGQINEKDFLRIRLLDGRMIFLRNRSKSEATLERLTGKTVYEAEYSIHKDDILLLETLLIDEVGILWSSGFESYPVANVDFLNHHLLCLKKQK